MQGINPWWHRVCYFILLMLSTAAGAASIPRDFVAGSYQAVLDAHQGEPFVLIFWSLDCPPCYRELGTLGKLVTEQPDSPLVLVSTDEKRLAQEAASLLEEKGLSAVESWIFAEAFAQPLRFEVDRNWYGELPRSYFFDAAHHRHAASGVLDESELRAWLTQQGVKN